MTKRDAAVKWRSEMNAIQTDIILALHKADLDSWREVTTAGYGDIVYHYPSESYGEIKSSADDDGNFTIWLADNKVVKATSDEIAVERDTLLPMWSTMWSFSDSADEHWIDDPANQEAMSACGFRIYEHDDFGYFFGVDSNDIFIDRVWLPLYEARGLQWHDRDEPSVEEAKPSLKETLKANDARSKSEFGDLVTTTTERGEPSL